MGIMPNWTDPDLLVLGRLYLQNEHSFVVRRCVQRFAAGEMTAQDAVLLIRELPDVRDEGRFPENSPDTWSGLAATLFAVHFRSVLSEPASHQGQVHRTLVRWLSS